MDTPLGVKFRCVGAGGEATGLFASKGTLSGEGFSSKRLRIECDRFVRADARAGRVHMWTRDDTGGVALRSIEVYRPRAESVARAFNRIASESRLLARQEELEASGRGAELRVARCGACDGMIDLGGFAESKEVYCPYCETVTNEAVPGPEQDKIRRCDRCGYFSMPRTFSYIYVCFLVVAFGIVSGRKHLCGPCMRMQAWMMLAGNAPCLLGVPIALTQLARAYFGGTALGGTYGGLEAGNVLAKRRQPDRALERYAEISSRLRGSAVAAYNSGLAFDSVDRAPEARRAFEASLRACSNFEPGTRMLAGAIIAEGKEAGSNPLLAPFLRQGQAMGLELAPPPVAADMGGQAAPRSRRRENDGKPGRRG